MKIPSKNLAIKIINRLTYYWLKFTHALLREEISSKFSYRHYNIERNHPVKDAVQCHTDGLLSLKSKSRITQCLEDQCSYAFQQTIKSADLTCKHIFNIFGREHLIGPRINWHKDYVSGHEWPLGFYADIKVINLADKSDVRFPWELSRFYHAVTLGKAYWYTGNEKYTEEFISQVQSWTDGNPVGKGVNWNCAMEAGIRAVNLLWAYCFFIHSKMISEDFHVLFLNLIVAHGSHIFKNLENRSSINGNHYIANLIGLFYIGTFLPMIRYSDHWRTFALRELIHSMEKQVCEDGTNFEGSIPYHRFVTEMFLHATLLATMNRHQADMDTGIADYRLLGTKIFGPSYIQKFEKMCEFILSYTRPDGLAPQIGDNDNGRLIKLGNHDKVVNDHRHILTLAGEFFDRDDFRSAGRESYEEAIWLFDGWVKQPIEKKPVIDSKAYTDAGLYIIRKDRDYAIIRCGHLGTAGKGTHTHNDNLSFELCVNGTPYLVDPGTFTYSGDVGMRNLLRSTRYHNTLTIDGVEQNKFDENDMFVLRKNSKPKVLTWKQSPKEDLFAGENIFQLDNGDAVTHKRELRLDKQHTKWFINDTVTGDGTHDLEWNFHANPGISIKAEKDRVFFYNSTGEIVQMDVGSRKGLACTVMEGWYSHSYGNKAKTQILNLAIRTEIPFDIDFIFFKL